MLEKDEDGASLLPFSSSSGSIMVPPGNLTSFYFMLSSYDLIVRGSGSLEGEIPDESAAVSENYSGLKIHVGRGVGDKNAFHF